ncbi:MAG: hypothetical protein ACO39X_04180 [Candidatus Nanopelagicaceae bacterium]
MTKSYRLDAKQLDPKSRIQGPGLTKPGVVILQSLLITLLMAIEITIRGNVGVITGIGLWIAFGGAIYLGRAGTVFTAVVTPPITFAVMIILLLPTLGGSTIRISRFALDLVSGLAGIAPFLVTGALVGWVIYFARERKS